MPESETEAEAAERERKPALPPFGGSAATTGPVLRPGTNLRGRKTLPPFFGSIRPGGPLPGATVRQPAPVVSAPRPRVDPPRPAPSPAPMFVPEATPSRPTPQTPPAPSWDTPPMPLPAAALAPDASRTERTAPAPADPAATTGEAEWAAPVAHSGQISGAYQSTETAAEGPAEAVAETGPHARIIGDFERLELQPDAEYATKTQENLPRAPTGGHQAVDASTEPYRVPPAPSVPDRATPPTDRAPILPPSLFADQPLAALEATPGEGATADSHIADNVRSDDITDMFAERYDASQQSAPADPNPRRSYRKTPPLGTVRPGHATPIGSRAQPSARMGRRATPVLGPQAITPINVPQVRRTPMAPAIAIIEPAPASAPPPPQWMVVGGSPTPTPIAVPPLQDLAASRTIAYALETVAARIRTGQIGVAGQVPAGDDVGSLAAALAAALAALLGVQR